MTRKTAKSYTAVFEFIEKNIFRLKPYEFMTDFEDGMRLAIKNRWPKAKIRGCWFHLSRAVERRYRKLGLRKLRNRKAILIKKMLKNIPLLPENMIEAGLSSIIEYSKKKRLFNKMARLFSYFKRYWMKQVAPIPLCVCNNFV